VTPLQDADIVRYWRKVDIWLPSGSNAAWADSRLTEDQ